MDRQEIYAVDQALHFSRPILAQQLWAIEPGWAAEAFVTLAVIHLNDALALLRRAERRVDFVVDAVSGEDITTRIANYRNAACHSGSPLRRLEPGINVSFMVLGPGARAIQGVQAQLANPDPDDVAYVYGSTLLLHHRHLLRAWDEALAALRRIVDEDGRNLRLLTADR